MISNMNKKQFIAICGLLGAMTVQAQPLLKTHVETGDLEGVLDGTDLAVYKAIPFAAPPVGDLRWKAPQPAKPWQGVLKAEECAKWPPQPERGDVSFDMMSEDCLYLSVVTPAKTVDEALPVIVYIHGGGFMTEHYSATLWQNLARRGVITVSIAYRVGALGFLAHPELSKESPDGHSGNYGILDQIFALQWIQRNIKNFGGDPSKVTIFGESSGGMSCNILCASPLAKGLFRACISHSGAFFTPMHPLTQRDAETWGVKYQERLGKNSIEELRQMDSRSLTGGGIYPPCTPVFDGYVLNAELFDLYEHGEYNDVPVIVMYNNDEGAGIESVTLDEYQEELRDYPKQFVDSMFICYPAENEEQALFAIRDMVRDLNYAADIDSWAKMQTKTGKSPVYYAYFAQKSERTILGRGNLRGAAHADDCLYMGGAFDNEPEKYPHEYAVSEMLQQYWTNFAKHMNPNGKGLPYWPAFSLDPKEECVMQFRNGATLIANPNQESVGLMERLFDWTRSQRTIKP